MDLSLGDTRMIIDACLEHGLLRNECAYVLATAYHETAHQMRPVREYGGEKYLKSKPYYPYVGMGYVQLTWKANYEKAGKKLGVDFVKHPKYLLDPKYSAPILVIGMKEGWFTGKKLSDYIDLHRSDFTGARKIVNGTDKARLIADIAIRYNSLLLAEGYGVEPADAPSPLPAPQQPAKPQTPPAAKSALPIEPGKVIVLPPDNTAERRPQPTRPTSTPISAGPSPAKMQSGRHGRSWATPCARSFTSPPDPLARCFGWRASFVERKVTMWTRIKAFFSDSETIFWARLQAFIGVVAGIVTYVDPAVLQPIIPGDWFPVFLVINGVLTEFLRRRRAEDLR